MWAAVINVLIGLWVMVAPGLFEFGKAPANNHYIVGPLVITMAVASIWEVNRSFRYFNFLAGIWLAVSAGFLAYASSIEIVNSFAPGILLIFFSLSKGETRHQFGGGWKALFIKSDFNFFKDKVIVITGASGGVGRVTAWEFAKQGAKVVLVARDSLQLEGAKKEVEHYGGKALTVIADIADPDQVEDVANRAEREFGPIDVWINNAMNSVFAPLKEITAQEFRRVTEVTYLGTIYGAMAALKRMLPRNKGSIVFVGSALAYRGIPLQSAYCGAKHGVEGFYDSLRTELMHDKSNIRTCMVQLPAMNTTQFGWVLSKLPNKAKPMGKVYKPEVAAKAILFAARQNRREILVGFPSYKAIVGNKIAPWYADWVLSREGYEGQQTNEPADPDRKSNLWEPVREDRGAYGDFGASAASRSFTLWISMNRSWVRAIILLVVLVSAMILFWI
jgi:short-subunit dehydrogenase